jgi:hypothetical protein
LGTLVRNRVVHALYLLESCSEQKKRATPARAALASRMKKPALPVIIIRADFLGTPPSRSTRKKNIPTRIAGCTDGSCETVPVQPVDATLENRVEPQRAGSKVIVKEKESARAILRSFENAAELRLRYFDVINGHGLGKNRVDGCSSGATYGCVDEEEHGRGWDVTPINRAGCTAVDLPYHRTRRPY